MKERVFKLMVVALLVGAAPFLVASGGQESSEAATMESVTAALESPFLAEKVAAGEIPPLEERLPEVPFVVRDGVLYPSEDMEFKPGKYGGNLSSTHQAPGWAPDVFLSCNEPLIQGPGITGEDLIGNVVQDFEANSDGSVYTFFMRKGLKWSDGTPVTTEDVRFAYEDVLLNETLTPTFPIWMRVGASGDGAQMELSIIDEFTFQVTFPKSYWGFATQVAIVGWRGYTDFIKPKHYLTQFHEDYTSADDLAKLIAEEELAEDEWHTLFLNKDHTNWENTRSTAAGFPTLNPWNMVRETPERIYFERNPYYWKVDEEGKQLPYIDTVTSDLVANSEMLGIKIISGEVDYLYAGPSLINYPMFKENEGRSNYETRILDSHTIPATIYLNQTYDDPVWQEVVQNAKFRKALSIGLNRSEIIDAVWLGIGGEMPTIVPVKFDPDEANRLLDEIGLDKRNAEGWRLGPDGKVFEIPFELSTRTTEMVPTCELAVQHWQALGFKTTMKVIDQSLRAQRTSANELRATIERNHFPPWWARPTDGWFLGADWGTLWNLWRSTSGRDGVEPPPVVKKFYELTAKSMAVPPDQRGAVIDEYMEILYENVFFIPTIEKEKRPIIVRNGLMNVPFAGMTLATAYCGEMFYWEE